jgi:hypothetical protein
VCSGRSVHLRTALTLLRKRAYFRSLLLCKRTLCSEHEECFCADSERSRDEEKASRNRDQSGANTSLSSVSSLSALAPPFVVSFSSNGSSSFSDLSKGAGSSLSESVLTSSVQHRAGEVSQPTEFSNAGTHTMGRFYTKIDSHSSTCVVVGGRCMSRASSLLNTNGKNSNENTKEIQTPSQKQGKFRGTCSPSVYDVLFLQEPERFAPNASSTQGTFSSGTGFGEGNSHTSSICIRTRSSMSTPPPIVQTGSTQHTHNAPLSFSFPQ